MRAKSFTRNRKGAVSVMFAAAAIPMVGLIGLAVDFGIWNQTNATLSVAANVAALTAVKIAANATTQADPNWQTEGQTAALQWFDSEVGAATPTHIGTEGVTLTGGKPTVSVTDTNATIKATVNYAGTVPSVFGNILFGTPSYPISGSAVAQVTFAPYLNVEILLDDSGSMEIGALNADIAQMQALTPCYPNLASLQPPNQAKIPPTYQAPGAFYNGSGSNLAGQAYGAYNYDGYDGGLAVPQPAYDPPLTNKTYVENTQPSCQGVLNQTTSGKTTSYPQAGPPCAFACHFDTTVQNAGSANDYYGIARSTIGTLTPITLRFDLVKAATNQVISAMQGDNIAAINNLNVGVFTFADTFQRVYPIPSCGVGTLACEAGDNWATAISLVGAPPTIANGADTGIQPYNGGNGGNSDFHDTLTNLIANNYLSASGDGTKPTTPRKVLFLVTDGLQDYTDNGNRTISGISSADCQLFKNIGYTVYVVFTPYYPIMNGFYNGNVKSLAEPTSNSTISQAMQACSSNPSSDYVSASDGPSLNAALQKFLLSALQQPARFVQ
jgi:Flp pilus assembly protein TadG